MRQFNQITLHAIAFVEVLGMQKRRLGKSGLVVSEICLGTMTMGAQMDRPQSLQMLDTARDHGVNFIDTQKFIPFRPP